MSPSRTVQFIDQLKTTEVRLLARSVFAPALLTLLRIADKPLNSVGNVQHSIRDNYQASTVFNLDSYYKNWLNELDAQPQNLLQHLTQSTKKLGIYHENLWAYFLAHSGRTKLLAHNLKIRNANRDLGELDFIYQHEDYGFIHLEVACKFYLGSKPESRDWEYWLGPNRSDNLARKIHHSIKHQLPLSDHALARQTIAQKFADNKILLPDGIHKQLHIGGRLFYKNDGISKHNPLIAAPHLINPSHLKGKWLTHSQWCSLCARNYPLSATIAEKPYWLDSSEHLLAANNNTDLEKIGKVEPNLLACKNSERSTHFVFIVPDGWNEETPD